MKNSTFNIKSFLVIFIILAMSLTTQAQSGYTLPTDQNYILTRTMLDENGSSSLDQIQYYDGLGRPNQTVQKGITPAGSDLVSYQGYDHFGRADKQWIPTPVPSNNGGFVTGIENKAQTYHSDQNPYVRTDYENSPLNRVVKELGVGAAWHSPSKGISTDYQTNTTSGVLSVTRYSVKANDALNKNGVYAAGELYVQKITDEDNSILYTFTDKLGQLILERRLLGVQQINTYYVYDDFGNRRYVLPPLAADALSANGDYILSSGNVLDLYAYYYRYDGRNRCIEKKLPGISVVYMVYDRSDRMVLAQTGNQRDKELWTIYKYDMLGRLLYTSEVRNQSSFEEMRSSFETGLVVENFVESGQSSAMGAGYSNSFFQNLPTRLLTVNYYDDYRFLDLLSSTDRSRLNYQVKSGYGTQYTNAKTMLTGTRVYDLTDPNKYVATSYYYDERGRLIQERSTNMLDGYDATYTEYDFTGNPLKTYKEHKFSASPLPTTELYEYAYDHAKRLTTTSYQLGTHPKIVQSENFYDEQGRLVTKYRHNRTDTLRNEYNIRNWLTKIKSGGFEENIYYNANPKNLNPCFNGNISAITWKYNNAINGYSFTYDKLNRLVSSFASKGAAMNEGYLDYEESLEYDKHGNITNLFRSTPQYGGIDLMDMYYTGNQLRKVLDEYGSQHRYNVKEYQDMSDASREFYYDYNGNLIVDLDRDIMAIRYNLLNLPDTIQFKNGNQIINRYAADGRKLRTDYFTLETPVVVPMSSVCKWEYEIDVIDQYANLFMDNCEYTLYKDPDMDIYSLTRINNMEGYSQIFRSPNYYYYHRDHLGNNREVWLANTKVTQQRTQYYPSGLPWMEGGGLSQQPYKFGGKEYVETHGYDTYDFVARGYYASIGRFMTMDPLAEKYYSISPYAYCANNPIRYIDPDGRRWKENKDKQIADDMQKNIKRREASLSKRESKINRKIEKTKKNTKIDENKRDKQIAKQQGKLEDVKTQKSFLSSLNKGLIQLNQSKNTYTFKKVETLAVLSSLSDGTIIINNYGTLGSKSHEVTHAIQYDNGLISFNPLGTDNAIIKNPNKLEIEAYATQYSITGGEVPASNGRTPRSIFDINLNWLRGLTNPDSGRTIYTNDNYE